MLEWPKFACTKGHIGVSDTQKLAHIKITPPNNKLFYKGQAGRSVYTSVHEFLVVFTTEISGKQLTIMEVYGFFYQGQI